MSEPRRRRVRVVVTPRDLNDPAAFMAAVFFQLEKKHVKVDLVVEPEAVVAEQATNEELEAKVTDQVGKHLDRKPPPEPPRPDTPAVDMAKVEEARSRIRRTLTRVAVAGWKLTVTTTLSWLKRQLEGAAKSGGAEP